MRPARKGPENRGRRKHRVARLRASMRPARKGPENLQHEQASRAVEQLASMRPARKGPENPIRGVRGVGSRVASMRPARKGPENRKRPANLTERTLSFNEAGPQGAGKPSTNCLSSRRCSRLQ